MCHPKKREEIIQPIHENFRYIPLTQKQIAIVDESDFIELSQYYWHALWNKNTKSFYAVRKAGEAYCRKTIYMHRFIMGVNIPDIHVDHKEPDKTLNNRRSNLRICTPLQNRWNSRSYKNNTSGFRGVTKFNGPKPWKSQAKIKGIPTCIGYFYTPEEAYEAFKNAVREERGEFARFD